MCAIKIDAPRSSARLLALAGLASFFVAGAAVLCFWFYQSRHHRSQTDASSIGRPFRYGGPGPLPAGDPRLEPPYPPYHIEIERPKSPATLSRGGKSECLVRVTVPSVASGGYGPGQVQVRFEGAVQANGRRVIANAFNAEPNVKEAENVYLYRASLTAPARPGAYSLVAETFRPIMLDKGRKTEDFEVLEILRYTSNPIEVEVQ